jgi:hypothetical protein
MSDNAPPPARSQCLTDEEVAGVRAAPPGDVPETLARHLASCARCQERVLFGPEPRRRRRAGEGLTMPTPARALVLLAIMVVVLIAFFYTLNQLFGDPERYRPPQAGPSTGSRVPDTGADRDERRKAITLAMAAGEVQPERSVSGIAFRLAGVSIVPGITALNRTPLSRFSEARMRVRAWTADLDTA